MAFFDKLPIPKHLSSRIWLLTVPSALISFERRQKVPQLPIGRARLAGIPIIAAGIAVILWATRENGKIPYSGPMSELTEQPATAGGIIAVAGVAVLLRSTALAAYTAALVFMTRSEQMTLEDPDLEGFIPGGR